MTDLEGLIRDVVLRHAGETMTGAEKLHDGVLAETFAVGAGERELILKLYRFDLGATVEADPDRRFAQASRHLTLSPFFVSSAERIDPLRGSVPLALPSILAEGRLPHGGLFTLMERMPGRPLAETEHLNPRSRELGALLRRMHDASAARAQALGLAPWPEEYEPLLHALADRMPEVALSSGGRGELRERFQIALERFANLPFGPTVVIHGDFGPDHVFVDEGGAPTGLIDFSLSCIAPAALDFRWLEPSSPGALSFDVPAFLEGYGLPAEEHASALWLGRFARTLWTALILVVLDRYSGLDLPAPLWEQMAGGFRAELDRLDAQPGASAP